MAKNLKKNSASLSREYIYKKISNLLRDDIDNGVYEPGTSITFNGCACRSF